MGKINQLSTLKIASLLKRPGRYGDGLNLYLHVRRPGSANWVFRYQIDGKPRWLGLGPDHSVSLAEARVRAREARQCIIDGRDPLDTKRSALAERKAEQLKTVTFAEAVSQFLATAKVESFKNDKHRKQWRSTLESVFPTIGALPLNSIDTAVILSALLPIWKRTPETGSRLRGRIARVFDWAKALDLYQGENPASWDRLKDCLPAKPKVEHHKAMPYADVPAFMARLRERDSVSARALELTILTAVRTQEAIGARWSEIDIDAATWTIPASRMKAKRDHRVPLSHRAVEILRNMPRVGAHVFINGGGKPLSNMAMSELLKGMDGNSFTVHGFRSSFSDWARDRTGYPRDVIEMALAHTIKDKAEAAYRRGDALDKRRRLMAEWARYLEAPATASATIHSIGHG
jgi:integrase